MKSNIILEEKNHEKQDFATLLALSLALSLTACGSKSNDAANSDAQTEQPAENQETVTLNVAASPTPHAEILKECVPILAEQGIDLQVHEYSDYVIPNTAVEDGEEDANYFQHIPYLDDFNAQRGTHLVSVTGVHIEPMGIYAGKTATLDELARRCFRSHPQRCHQRGPCPSAAGGTGPYQAGR